MICDACKRHIDRKLSTSKTVNALYFHCERNPCCSRDEIVEYCYQKSNQNGLNTFIKLKEFLDDHEVVRWNFNKDQMDSFFICLDEFFNNERIASDKCSVFGCTNTLPENRTASGWKCERCGRMIKSFFDSLPKRSPLGAEIMENVDKIEKRNDNDA